MATVYNGQVIPDQTWSSPYVYNGEVWPSYSSTPSSGWSNEIMGSSAAEINGVDVSDIDQVESV